jgi:cytochrome c oxidase subunit 2
MPQSKLGFIVAILVLACVFLGIRYYEVDIPLWRLITGKNILDPALLHLEGEFVESNLGAAQEPDGSITVRMIAQQFVFVPRCIVVPAGVPVHIRITSADVVHKLSLPGTDLTLKAVPGSVTETRRVFADLGDFGMPCQEFCGAGHYTMRSELRVIAKDQFPPLAPDQRRDCVAH